MRMEAEKKSAEYEKRLRLLEPKLDKDGGERGSYRGDKAVHSHGGAKQGSGGGGGFSDRGQDLDRAKADVRGVKIEEAEQLPVDKLNAKVEKKGAVKGGYKGVVNRGGR